MGFAIKNIQSLIRAALAIAIMLTLPAFPVAASVKSGNTPDNRVLAVKLQKGLSLDDLIRTAGYEISDEDIVLFLTEFMELNPAVKSVSTLKKGTLVRVPVRHLKKIAGQTLLFREKAELSGLKKRITRKRTPAHLAAQEPLKIDRSMLLRNIQRLFSSLGEDVSLEKEGFKYFDLNEKSDISFDTGLFPLIDLHDNRVLVIDYTSAFPDDLKNLLEVAWPEYRVVSPHGSIGLRSIVPILLQESGYLFQGSSKMVSGGATQVEYYTDFLVHGKNGRPMESDISLVSVLDSSEYQTPQEIISWFRNRDIRIIELSEQDRKYLNKNPGTVLDLQGNNGGKALVENVLTLLGYPYSRDEKINLSPGKEIGFNIRADLLVDMGYKKKLVEFSGVSEQEMKYVRKLGLDIVQIEPWEGKNDVIRKIMSLLSLNFTNSPQRNVVSLSPRKTRYRLLVPGFVVKSLKGEFFMTDTDLDAELLKSIVGEGISVVKF